MGDYYVVGNFADKTMTFLRAGNPVDRPMVAVADLQLNFPAADWYHPTLGIAARAVPDSPGFFDLVFNAGSQFNGSPSTSQVTLRPGPKGIAGLSPMQIPADSLYSVRLDARTDLRVVKVTRIVSGIRNVMAMGFHPITGDFYFADNAIDGPNPDGDEPPQADELNRLSASEFGTLIDFGFPTCYIQYRTGSLVGSGCRQPLSAFQPIPAGSRQESEGPAAFAFAPLRFPQGFNHGLFVGFSGKGSTGPSNEENAIVFHDLSADSNLHFTESGQSGVGRFLSLFADADSLYASDFNEGVIYRISPAQTTSAVPAISAGGIVNAASFSPALAPGTFAASFGVNLAAGATALGSPPLGLSLSGVEVRVRGNRVPVHFVADGQVNFYIPLNFPPGPATVTILTTAGESLVQTIQLGTYAPGVFPLTHNYGAILNSGTANTTEGNPAAIDSFVEVYATGLGPVGSDSRTSILPTVTIGGTSSQVVYSGMTAIPGLYQVNVRIPRGLSSGAQPLVIEIGGQKSVPVLIGIQ